ncbi:Uncharacterised protein [Kingella negevensis]|uniref:Uncharacterized protein n=1 Tax=Kingella negevensis TaxID=1522312 RepID=A0A238TDU5_9NEIS|nr:Uncharacterised protein [Kingella negevensis]
MAIGLKFALYSHQLNKKNCHAAYEYRLSAWQHQFCKLLTRLSYGFLVKRHANAYHIIMRWQAVFMLSEPIAYHSFHKIAAIGAFGGFFADHQTQSCMTKRIICRLQHLQETARTLFSQCKNGREIFRFQQSVCFTEAIVQLHSQAFTTFGTACCQYCATAASF